MFQGMKSSRQLSLLIALALSAGGQPFFNHAHAADVTGGDVYVDGTPAHPVPPAPVAGGAITNAADSGKVHGNKITVSGTVVGTVCGGYTAGSGDATGNTATIKNAGSITYMYGGWSNTGNATGNTVVLSGTEPNAWMYMNVYGGGSNNPGADVTTGNTLIVRAGAGYGNGVNWVRNFEYLIFEPASDIAPGQRMLGANSGRFQAFDWNKVKVGNAETWTKTTGFTPINLAYMYASALTVYNYDAVQRITADGTTEYGWYAEGSPTPTGTLSTKSVSNFFFDRNQFKEATSTVTAPPAGGIAFGGLSLYGNTTTKNKLTLDGVWFGGTSCGGYTKATKGDSTENEVILKNNAGTAGNIYGGYADNGDATGNTITLSGTHSGSYSSTNLYGGGSSKPGANVMTGNTLKVTTAGNGARTINNFEKMAFVLGSGINSGDTMLSVAAAGNAITFDWSNITTEGVSDWADTLATNGIYTPTLTLYTGAGLTLNNYAPALLGTRGDYELGKQANGTLSSITMTGATQLMVSGNRFQNAGKNQNVTTPGATT